MKLFTSIMLCVFWAVAAFGQPARDSSGVEPKPLEPSTDASVIELKPPQPATDASVFERKPLKISSGIDEGQIVSGQAGQGNPEPVSHNWISRLNVFLIQEVNVAKRLTLKVGVGGFIWNPYPDPTTSSDILFLAPKFAAAVSEASGTYKIGDVANPLFEFQFGYFPFKYNPEAYDMGEYLLKSGAYPGYLVNGRWNIIGDNLYRALGVRFSNYLLNGALEMHLLATMERDYPPEYDISPTFVIKGNIFAKMLSLGGGACYSHLISMNEDRTTPKDGYNRYLGDRALSETEGYNGSADSQGVQYYTFRGLKLMGMASFDIKPVIPTKVFGKEDLKVFVEAAVLGVQDYPFYYDDIKKRIPIMFGFNFPTFKILDVLSFEWEWYGSQFANNMSNAQNAQDPTWYISPDPLTGKYNPATYDDTAAFSAASGFDKEGATTWRQYNQMDTWKWAIYAKKSLGKAVSLHLQLANDHMRMITYPNVFPDYSDATRGVDKWYKMFQKDWYFDFKVQIGI
jgi:hypothetical protein